MPKIRYFRGIDAIAAARPPMCQELRQAGQLHQETDNGQHARAAIAMLDLAVLDSLKDETTVRLEHLQYAGALITLEIENILHHHPALTKPNCTVCRDTGLLDAHHLAITPCPHCNTTPEHPTGRV